MRAASTDFATAVRRSHQVATTAEVLDADGVVLWTFGEVVAGNVSQDRNAAIRATCDVTVAAGGLLAPGNLVEGTITYGTDIVYGEEGYTYGSGAYNPLAALLAPFGNVVRLKRGIVLDDGTTELVGLGVFRITRSETSRAGDGIVVRLAGADVSRIVARNKWTDTYQVAAGTNYATAIQAMITDRYPTATFDFVTTTHTTPLVVLGLDGGSDPWRDAQAMAAAVGLELFVNGDGTFVLAAEPVPTMAAADFTLSVHADQIITRVGRTLDDDSVLNGVVATGENSSTTPPVRAVVWDTNTASLTYYLGPYGKAPFLYSSSLITTVSQAGDAALAQLKKLLGFDDTITLDIVPDPRIEAGDIVKLSVPNMHLLAAYMIQTVACPLEASGVMSLTLVTRRTEL